MKEYKAVAINEWVTARETNAGTVLLFVPTDVTEADHYIPPQEIHLRTEDIKRLYREFVEPTQREANHE